ncbi:hypothetical protein [Bacillus mycoides]|uniref:Uncharacterized protein n=1 Tax=Bacillus mycoides TaxID=1405 RepID=A0A1G4EMV3_BACMY|nr:hypothetical protein [Bacillus mycoides]SCB67379.1 Uncharacterized protein BWGO95_01502 [Bacillus mycoides]
MSGKRKDVKMHVTTEGEFNSRRLAETIVRMVHRDILNGEIRSEKSIETSETKNSIDKKE